MTLNKLRTTHFHRAFHIIIFLSFSLSAFCQDTTKIKETKILLSHAKTDSLKIELLIKLSGFYSGANADSSMIYATEALEMAKTKNDENLLSKSYHNIGIAYYYKGDYNIALEYMFKSLKISEKLNIKKEIGPACNNIGNIYLVQGNYDGALEFYFRDLEISKDLGDETNIAKTIGNIGLIYDEKGDYDKALEYYHKAADLSEKLGDKDAFINANINMAVVYQWQKEPELALEYLLIAYDMAKEINNQDALTLIYINGGSCYIDLKNFEKAEDYLNKAVDISKVIGSKNNLRYAYKYLSRLYYKKADYKSSIEYLNTSAKYKDSIFNEEKSRQFAEMQTRFETEKKQKQIEIQNLELTQQDLEINKKQFIIYGTTAGFILMVLLALISYNSYRQKKKANLIILYQNSSLEQANEEISTQRDEIETQRDMLENQRDVLENQNIKITASIQYAKYIQQAVLPSQVNLDALLNDYFVLFKPKDIVSGDFYWAAKVKTTLILAVSDCTGHGVPGAIMSMLGISFLNEIVRKKEITKASDVLNHLRDSIVEALQQKGVTDEQKDGMDISIITIDLKNSNGKLLTDSDNVTFPAQWAGANNSIYIITPLDNSGITRFENELTSSKIIKSSNSALVKIKPDKMPISIYRHMHEFTNHEFTLYKNDKIYLMSDGYADQFGGPNANKFLSKNLRQLILENCQLQMNEQKINLENRLTDWMGNEEQIDDITVVGLKI